MKRPDASYVPDQTPVAMAWLRVSARDPRFASMRPAFGNPPCNGCTLCCETDTIIVDAARGDDPDQYELRDLGDGIKALAQKPNGDCVYLDRATGCTIHAQAPMVCREFDCRGLWLQRKTPAMRVHLINAEKLLGVKHPVVSRGGELYRRRLDFSKS